MMPSAAFEPIAPNPSVSAKPRSLDDQPWYTMIPFVPPPGWSWSDWWYQSTLF
jgi:hypothetical protein